MNASIATETCEYLLDVCQVISDSLDVDETARRLAECGTTHLADFCRVDLLEPSGALRRAGAARSGGQAGRARAEDGAEAIGVQPAGIFARVLEERRPVLLSPLSSCQLAELAGDAFGQGAPGSPPAVLVPIVSREQVLGVLTLVSLERGFGAGVLRLLDSAARLVRVRLDNDRLVERLRTSEVRLQAILDNASVLVFIKDAQGRYELVDRAFAERLGRAPDEIVGKSDTELYPPDVAQALRENDTEVRRTARPVMCEEVVPTQQGWRTSLAVKFPLPATDGEAPAVCGISTDITERKLEGDEVRRTSEFRERLLGIVSHDLRNPLNAIILSAHTLLQSEELPERATRAVRRIVTSGERMGRMISDLLDFTRGRLGAGIPILRRDADLGVAIREVVSELELTHPTRKLRLVTRGKLRGPFDDARIAQAVGNVIKNAITYSPEDSPVSISVADEGAGVEVQVHNSGAPIPPKLMPHLFDAFRQGDERGASGGLGLGLYIVREIASAHGGSVRAQSSEVTGTTLTLRFPRRPLVHTELQPEAAAPAHH